MSEEEQLERALEEADSREIIADLLPRATRIYGELKEGTEPQELVGAFIIEARRFLAGEATYEGQYQLHPGWIGETLAPIVLRWEDILARRQEEAAASNFLGNAGQAIFAEATVTFVKKFENPDWGDRWLTIAKDDSGNVLKYWNAFHVFDEVDRQAAIASNGGVEPEGAGKRDARAGDKVKFKATVKGHEIYKGVKSTVIQRARKAELLQRAPDPTE